MRNIKEILRLVSEGNLSIRQIARTCNCSHSTVLSILGRAKTVGVSYPVSPELTDHQLEELMYPPAKSLKSDKCALPDMQYIHGELKRKGVTLQLLWQEYKEQNPQGLMYSQFCEHYRQWRRQSQVSMHMEHRAGEKCFVDWAGPSIPIIDPETGEIEQAYLFIAVLGASNYTFALACRSMEQEEWINAHCLAFNYFGGVTTIIIPDNLKVGVQKPSYYEPTINRTYQEMANHYNTVIIPARVYRPRDYLQNRIIFKVSNTSRLCNHHAF
jgi:transposase